MLHKVPKLLAVTSGMFVIGVLVYTAQNKFPTFELTGSMMPTSQSSIAMTVAKCCRGATSTACIAANTTCPDGKIADPGYYPKLSDCSNNCIPNVPMSSSAPVQYFCCKKNVGYTSSNPSFSYMCQTSPYCNTGLGYSLASNTSYPWESRCQDYCSRGL